MSPGIVGIDSVSVMSVALVTGATAGIGAEFARQLAARGDDLVLVARDADRLATTAGELRARYGVTVEVLPADLSDRDQLQRVADRIAEGPSAIDLVVNNAGFGMHRRLLSPDVMDEVDLAIDVMLRAVIQLSGVAGRAMQARGGGAIVNISSTAGFVTMGAYSAIKAAVTTYTEALSLELRGTGVTATAVCPGWVRTEFHDRAGIRTGSIPAAAWVPVDVLVSESLADVARGAAVSIPTRRWSAAIAISRLLPRPLVRAISAKLRSGR